jgi:hypothetical protein
MKGIMTALKHIVNMFLIGNALILGACISDIDTEDINLESTEQSVSQGWTYYTSDELAPIQCDSASLVSDVAITGRYADNIRLYCTPTSGTLGYQNWSNWFSEETSPNQAMCDSGRWMTGLACSGSYCDRLSIQCSDVGNVTQGFCHWTGEISEEGHYLHFGGSYARGVKCLGSYCDRLSFYVCPAW